jgi:hypothetical protein
MSDVIDLVARLHAFQRNRAVPIATHQQVIVQPHAMVIAPIAMAGEDTTVHALAVGRIGAPATVRVVPDPRVRDDHYELLTWLGGEVEAYYAECRDAGDFPQIWTASSGAAGHLDIVADRLRFTRENPAVRRAGDLLTYVTERAPVAGQQALLTATGALSAHFRTGQPEGEDEHLGALLTWVEPPAGVDFRTALRLAEREVMGVKTDPEFDRLDLQPLVAAYGQAKRTGASEAELRGRAAQIENLLEPIVVRVYDAIQRAIQIVDGRWPSAPMLDDLHDYEAKAFASFMNARDRGLPLPYRDTPKAAAFKMVERERAAQNVESGAVYGDALTQTRALLQGRLLSVRVQNVQATKVGRKTEHRLILRTDQQRLRVRAGDEFANLDAPKLRGVIEAVRRDGAETQIMLLITAGMRAVGVPVTGAQMRMGAAPPAWGFIYKEMGKLQDRLAQTPWTHSADASAPVAVPRTGPRPADLVAAVEALR